MANWTSSQKNYENYSRQMKEFGTQMFKYNSASNEGPIVRNIVLWESFLFLWINHRMQPITILQVT